MLARVVYTLFLRPSLVDPRKYGLVGATLGAQPARALAAVVAAFDAAFGLYLVGPESGSGINASLRGKHRVVATWLSELSFSDHVDLGGPGESEAAGDAEDQAATDGDHPGADTEVLAAHLFSVCVSNKGVVRDLIEASSSAADRPVNHAKLLAVIDLAEETYTAPNAGSTSARPVPSRLLPHKAVANLAVGGASPRMHSKSSPVLAMADRGGRGDASGSGDAGAEAILDHGDLCHGDLGGGNDGVAAGSTELDRSEAGGRMELEGSSSSSSSSSRNGGSDEDNVASDDPVGALRRETFGTKAPERTVAVGSTVSDNVLEAADDPGATGPGVATAVPPAVDRRDTFGRLQADTPDSAGSDHVASEASESALNDVDGSVSGSEDLNSGHCSDGDGNDQADAEVRAAPVAPLPAFENTAQATASAAEAAAAAADDSETEQTQRRIARTFSQKKRMLASALSPSSKGAVGAKADGGKATAEPPAAVPLTHLTRARPAGPAGRHRARPRRKDRR